MAAAKASAETSLDSGRFRCQQTLNRSCRVTGTCLLSSNAALPPASARCPSPRQHIQLPLLVTARHPRTSKFSLRTPGRQATLPGFCHIRRPEHRKLPVYPLMCQTCDVRVCDQSYRPLYTHFCTPVRPVTRLERCVTMRHQRAPEGGALIIQGTQLHNSHPASFTATPLCRTELHVFLPRVGTNDSRGPDGRSAVEGFTDELESRVDLLSLQQQAPKTPAHLARTAHS
ncbi:hypothetical protein GN956_G16946 [Arapaima gigas]